VGEPYTEERSFSSTEFERRQVAAVKTRARRGIRGHDNALIKTCRGRIPLTNIQQFLDLTS
jgi:hypothetical protein